MTPGTATIDVLRDPADWTTPGAQIFGAGAWEAAPVALGDWSVTAVLGSPAVVSVNDPGGLSPQGIVRFVVTGLGGASFTIAPGGGEGSIDRLIADASLTNVQLTSGLPVRELDAVQLSATASSTTEENPTPMLALIAAPPVIASWNAAAANTVAVAGFPSAGTTANFDAPAVYVDTALDFVVTAALDLANNGTIDAGDCGTRR